MDPRSFKMNCLVFEDIFKNLVHHISTSFDGELGLHVIMLELEGLSMGDVTPTNMSLGLIETCQ